ncbi:MAG TPA: Ig-like domain repeat protein [Vicinamibacterales bacterium]|nr:Ig-like domain repeat protein [Vicinamibacterales bacterium]
MGVCRRSRANQALLCGALIVTAISSRGPVPVQAQEPTMRWDGLIELVSGRNDSPPPSWNPPIPADGPSQMSRHAVSGDGRYVVFTANAPSIAGYYGPSLYLRDRRLSDTRLLLAGADTTGLRDAVISEDGRHVAFTVCEPWIRPDNMPICDVWAMDMLTSAWTVLSVSPDTGEFGNADSDEPVLSGNGRFVVFRTAATNLAPGVPVGVPQLVIKDRDPDGNGIYDEPGPVSPNSFQIVSAPKGAPGHIPGDAPSATAEVSDNGRYVAFRSAASNLVPGDTNGTWDVFRRDRQSRDTRRLNVQVSGGQSPYAIDSPGISMTPDGRSVAFASADPMLGPAPFDDTNNVLDVYVFDAQSFNVQRVDVGWLPYATGVLVPGSGPTEWPTLSADGRYVSVQSAATNVEIVPPPNSTHTYVVDRFLNKATRVSLKPDGTDPDHSCIQPQISADGSLVAFVSQAFNLTPNVYTDADRVYAAVHLEITPQEQSVPGSAGGAATYDVVTQQHTPWWIDWNQWEPWTDFETPPMGWGSGLLKVRANQANPDPTPRTATIKVFDKTVRFTQLAGLSLAAISPVEGPETGGTQVTFTGTGFEPGMRVLFGGLEATAIEYVNSTKVIATTPAHAPGTADVAVVGPAPDYRVAWLDQAFRFTDMTPPQLWYGFSDTPNEEGWFNREVTLSWAWMDDETPVTSTSGCDTAIIGVDTPGTTYTCTATSEGGTSSLSAFLKRDATAPTATITSPAYQLYDLGEVVQPAFTCSDALSGVASCIGGTNGDPIDTTTPGYHTFNVFISDRAGNPGYVSVDYAVGSGVCAYPLPDMVGWWRMEGNTSNTRSSLTTDATRVGLTSDVFVDAVVGQGYQFEGTNGYLLANYSPMMFSDKKLAFAAWVNPSANTLGTIMRARDFFGIARLATGTLGWTFRKWNEPLLSYRDTRVPLPLGQWSHVVVVLDGWAVRTYLNGRLAHTEPNVGDVINPSSYPVTFGGAQNVGDYFKGVLDELQIFQHGLNDAQIEQLFLAGSAGACVPKRTSFEIADPIPASFGSPTYPFDVRLVDEDGQPVSGKTVELLSQVGAAPYSTSTANRVTDADGRVHWDAPLKNAPRGLFEGFASATFVGDVDYVRTSSGPDVLVGKGNPVVTWPAPAPITYSFPVNGTQFNATASVPGTFSYSPPSGTLLPAGEGTLSVTFTPTDTANYNTVTATNTITVNKATPNVTIEGGGTWAYSGTPRAVVGKVKDRFNIVIATPTVTYDGSPDPPVLPGTYTVVATWPGNANYLAGTATETLTITKSVVSMQLFVQDAVYDGASHGAGYLINGFDDDFFPADGLTYNGSENPPVNVGTYTVVLTFNGTALYEAATLSKTFTIHKATPTVSVTGGTFTYDATAHPATGTVMRGAVSLGSPVFTYNGASEAPVNGGTYNVVGTYAGDANHNAASGSGTITINKAVPTVTVAGGAYIYDGQPHPATGTVTGIGGVQLTGLTFTYNGASEPPVNAGAFAVTATYPGNANYQSVTRDTAILIGPATPTLTVTGGTFTYDGMPHGATATVRGVGGVELAGALLTYNGSIDVPVNAGTYTAVATFDGSGNYGHATGSAVVTILKATAVLGWNRPAAIVYGTSLGGDQLNATANVFGSFDYTPPANTLLNAGASQTLTATFTPSDPANYIGGTVTTTIDVAKAAAEVTAIGGTFTYNGQPHQASGFVTGLFGASLGTPTFTYNGSPQPPVTVGTYEVVASFAGNPNYQPVSATTAISILPAAPILDWTQPQAIVYGTALGAAQLNATANVAGTFTYSPAAGTVLNAGLSQLLTATFTSSDPNYSSDSVINTVIDVSKASPVLNWSPLPAIVHGTPLAAAQLNATANVAGSFSYSPAAGAVLNAGAQTLTATFTPADSSNYSSGSVTATIEVSKATATVTAAGGTFTYDGQPHPATGSVTGLNGASLGAPSFTYNGSAQPPVAAGSYAVVASFAGNANYEPASASATITIGKAPVVLTWNPPAAIVYGTPLGAVQLNASANVPGTFAYSPAAGTVLSAGAGHALTAIFTPADGTNYASASVNTTIVVAAAPLSIRANDAAKPFGAPLPVFTASAAGFVNGDSFVSLGGALVFATSATAEAAIGMYPVVPSGLSSPNYVITFVPGTLAVVRGGVTVSVSTSPAPSGLNQSMTFTANVAAAAPAAGAPGGTVRFFDGATLLGSSTLTSGSASLTTAGLAAGVHTIQATYDGDASFVSGSESASHTVTSAAATPSIAIASNRNPSSVGQSVTLTANLSMTAGPVDGTVQFYDGAVLLGTSPIVSGSAVFTTTAFAAGSHAITARYLGSPSAPPVISGVFVQAVGSSGWKNRTSTTTLSSSPNPSALGGTVMLTANVSGPNGTPAGAVLFMVNGQVVGGPVTLTAISGSTAQATFALSGLAGGRHIVTATYLGSSNYKGSTAAVTQTVN